MSLPPFNSDAFSYNTYAEYVHAEHKALLSELPDKQRETDSHWLTDIFKDPWAPRSFGYPPLGDIHASIIDFLDGRGSLTWSSFFLAPEESAENDNSAQTRTAPGQLLQRIDQPEPEVAFRVVVLHFLPKPYDNQLSEGPLGLNNEAFIDVLGARYGLRPGFFVGHIQDKMLESDRRKQSTHLQMLPSEKNYITLEHSDGGFISTTLAFPRGGIKTAIVMDSSVPYHDRPSTHPQRYTPFLQEALKTQIEKGTEDPSFFLWLYVKQLLRHHQAADRRTHSCTNMRCKAKTKSWLEIYRRADSIDKVHEELLRFFPVCCPNVTPSDKFLSLLSDVGIVSKASRRYEQGVQKQVQNEAAFWTNKASDEMYEQAVATRRLALIAFIYIPLSFTASFLGMNVSELNGSGPSLAWFPLILFVSLGLIGIVGLFSTEWWKGITFRWREKVEPGHNCGPREALSLSYLIWATLKFCYRSIFKRGTGRIGESHRLSC